MSVRKRELNAIQQGKQDNHSHFVINCIDKDRLQWTSGCGVLHANLSWQRPACPNVLISIQRKE